MSIIQKIRDKYAAAAITVIAIAMVGFILIDALSSRTGGGLFKNQTSVGKVDGEKIEFAEFDARLNQLEQGRSKTTSPRGCNLTTRSREQLNNTLWKTLVGQKLIGPNKSASWVDVITPKELEEFLYNLWTKPPGAIAANGLRTPKRGSVQRRPGLADMIRAAQAPPSQRSQRLEIEDYLDNVIVKQALR